MTHRGLLNKWQWHARATLYHLLYKEGLPKLSQTFTQTGLTVLQFTVHGNLTECLLVFSFILKQSISNNFKSRGYQKFSYFSDWSKPSLSPIPGAVADMSSHVTPCFLLLEFKGGHITITDQNAECYISIMSPCRRSTPLMLWCSWKHTSDEVPSAGVHNETMSWVPCQCE